jgi:hypothetical protein
LILVVFDYLYYQTNRTDHQPEAGGFVGVFAGVGTQSLGQRRNGGEGTAVASLVRWVTKANCFSGGVAGWSADKGESGYWQLSELATVVVEWQVDPGEDQRYAHAVGWFRAELFSKINQGSRQRC